MPEQRINGRSIEPVSSGTFAAPVREPLITSGSVPDWVPPSRAPIKTDDLYAARDAVSRELDTALRLLKEATAKAQDAVEAFERDNDIEADDALQRLQAVLPELFCCRKLGDGYAAVVNAIMCAFENLEGIPPSIDQVTQILITFRSLRETPFMGLEHATDAVGALEGVGLVVEPPSFKYLADWLDDNQ